MLRKFPDCLATAQIQSKVHLLMVFRQDLSIDILFVWLVEVRIFPFS